MNSLLHENKASPLPSHDSAQQLADRFALFFKEKIDKIRRELPIVDPLPVYLPPAPAVLDCFAPTTVEEVRQIISRSPTSTCDLDAIPTWLLKDSLDATISHLVVVINSSLEEGLVPDEMKQALLRPLLKKRSLNREVLKNYCPVSNLSYTSKLLERVAAACLNSHMNNHNIHERVQSAYKPGHLTKAALLRVQNDILTNMDNQSVTVLILLDLSAAFDTIDNQVLLDRMENMVGVKGIPLQWFSSYLSGRTQSVTIDHVLSLVAVLLLFGVPQGSVLGPLLFLIYTLPLGAIIRIILGSSFIFSPMTLRYTSQSNQLMHTDRPSNLNTA